MGEGKLKPPRMAWPQCANVRLIAEERTYSKATGISLYPHCSVKQRDRGGGGPPVAPACRKHHWFTFPPTATHLEHTDVDRGGGDTSWV